MRKSEFEEMAHKEKRTAQVDALPVFERQLIRNIWAERPVPPEMGLPELSSQRKRSAEAPLFWLLSQDGEGSWTSEHLHVAYSQLCVYYTLEYI